MSDRLELESCILERYEYAAHGLEKLGLKVNRESNNLLTFELLGGKVRVYPFREWFEGQPLGKGRGINTLFNRIENLISFNYNI